MQTDYEYNERDQLVKETHTDPGVCYYLHDKPVYAYSQNGRITHYRLSDSAKNISPLRAWLMGIPTQWSNYLFRLVALLLPLMFLSPTFRRIISRRPCTRRGTGRVRRAKPLLRQGLIFLIAYVMFISPEGFYQLGHASIDYNMPNTDVHYAYDDNGSQIEKIIANKGESDPDNNFIEKTLYTYNLQNRLAEVKVTTDGTNWDVTTYKYNPDGIRIAKVVDGITTDYLIDAYNHTGYAQVFVEHIGSDNTTYVTGSEVLSQSTNTDTPKYLLHDGQGTVRQIANSDGTVSNGQSHYYDAYGNYIDWSDPPQSNLRYTGQQWDESAQMYYLRARYYNPLNGRFNRVDPYSGNYSDPQSLHKYLYAHGDPVNRIDPTGKFGIAAIAVGIVFVILVLMGGYTLWRGTRFIGDLYLTTRGRRGICGYDVTDQLRDFKKGFNEDSQDWNKTERCRKRLNPVIGWDITTLVKKAIKGSTGSCDGTATVNNKCYDQSAINYYLWGLGCKYCDDTEEEAIDRVYTYKTFFMGGEWHAVQQAYGFTRAGYRGITDFDILELTGASHKGCSANKHSHWETGFAYRFGTL